MPHGRHVSFWAKSTMFANPITGGILSSSGAIPVKRNPNNGSSPLTVPKTKEQDPSSSTNAGRNIPPEFKEGESRAMLFKDTSRALARHQVVGVFPEGTSYTQASIVQMLPGAGWAAVEYAQYMRERGSSEKDNEQEKGKGKGKVTNTLVETGLRIVPVAIVYTDKARYLSRVSVKYGDPIFIDSYRNELLEGERNEASKLVVKKVMARVETQLRDMTINATDWDVVCAVSMARSILWGDEDKIPLKDWVEISQRLTAIFENVEESSQNLKAALTKYYALLHYADIKHSVLLSLLPLSTQPILDMPPPHSVPGVGMLLQPTLSLLKGVPLALVQFICFVPPLLLHLPGYITGPLAKKCLAKPGEEEAAAQFKAVGGGLGIGANIALAFGVLWKQNKIRTLVTLLGLDGEDKAIKRLVGVAGSVYISVLVLVRWHKLLIKANYRQLRRLLTYYKLFSAFAFPRASNTLSTVEFDAFTKPPLPAVNVFIKKQQAATSTPSSWADVEGNRDHGTSRSPPSRKLVGPLLVARMRACTSLVNHLKTRKNQDLVKYLENKGAKIS